MKQIEVVAAIIRDGDKVLSTQRGYGDFKNGWEFPGGKIENGETHKQALKREILEELGIEINVHDCIGTIEHDYPQFHLTMHCYMCTANNCSIQLFEHESSKWLDKESFGSVDWLPADLKILEAVKKEMKWM